jgi:hypothetical protein
MQIKRRKSKIRFSTRLMTESEPIFHPTEPADTAFTISQDLIKGTDRFQVAIFLKTMESFMGSIVQNYQTIKQNCRNTWSKP